VRVSSASRRGGPVVDDEGADDDTVAYPDDRGYEAGRSGRKERCVEHELCGQDGPKKPMLKHECQAIQDIMQRTAGFTAGAWRFGDACELDHCDYGQRGGDAECRRTADPTDQRSAKRRSGREGCSPVQARSAIGRRFGALTLPLLAALGFIGACGTVAYSVAAGTRAIAPSTWQGRTRW
jgi:hypothetical protein